MEFRVKPADPGRGLSVRLAALRGPIVAPAVALQAAPPPPFTHSAQY